MDYQKRSHAGVMTIGVLQLVFGSLFLICGLFQMAGTAVTTANGPGAGGSPAMEQEVEAAFPHYKAISYVFMGTDVIVTLLMLGSGIGLVMMKPWGRTLANTYGIASILSRLLNTVYLIILMPAMTAAMDKEMARAGGKGGPGMAGFGSAIVGISVAVSIACMIYPTIVLVIVNMASSKAALSAVPLGPGEFPEDLRDDYRDPDRGISGEAEDRYRQPPDDHYRP